MLDVVLVVALLCGMDGLANALSPVNGVSSDESKKQDSVADGGEDSAEEFDYVALYDLPNSLRKLDKIAPIWATKDRVNVVLGGEFCLRQGLLEFFACRRDSKEHESIISLDIPPHLIHAALLAIGAKQGSPAKYDPVFVPPTGDEIEIEARWVDAKTKEVRKVRAQDLILENESGKIMQANWVFTGGLFGVDSDGKKYYLANVTGEIFGVSNFPGSVLDVPFESSSDNSELCYTPNTKMIPPVGTKVLLILTCKPSKESNQP